MALYCVTATVVTVSEYVCIGLVLLRSAVEQGARDVHLLFQNLYPITPFHIGVQLIIFGIDYFGFLLKSMPLLMVSIANDCCWCDTALIYRLMFFRAISRSASDDTWANLSSLRLVPHLLWSHQWPNDGICLHIFFLQKQRKIGLGVDGLLDHHLMGIYWLAFQNPHCWLSVHYPRYRDGKKECKFC